MALIKTPNGGLKKGADLTGDAQFFTVYTVVGVEAGDHGSTNNNNRNLNLLSEVIQQYGNLNYINVSSEVIDLSDADNRTFYGLGTAFDQAATTIYTVKFMVEQSGYVMPSQLNTDLDGLAVPLTTAAVPHNGGPENQTAFETSDAAEKNINILVMEDL